MVLTVNRIYKYETLWFKNW